MLRFLADASLNYRIVLACRRVEPAIDFLSSDDAGLEGLADSGVLALASVTGRILVTHDLQTMPQHFSDFLLQGGQSPGVFLVKQKTPLSEVADALVLIWAASDPAEWRDRILAIPL